MAALNFMNPWLHTTHTAKNTTNLINLIKSKSLNYKITPVEEWELWVKLSFLLLYEFY